MELHKISDLIYDYAEIGFETEKSCTALVNVLDANGFKVERPFATLDHAFLAKYGTGSIKVGLLAEYDALNDMSQVPNLNYKKALKEGEPGHGCGHNLLGVGVVAAALELKEYAEEYDLEINVYGCPAEETGSGKNIMAKEGAFDHLDFALSWHPNSIHGIWSAKTLAVQQVYYIFEGISAHASGAADQCRSALDAAEIMNIGVNYLREHMPSTARIHYAYHDVGGTSANVVQSSAKLHYYIRDINMEAVEALVKRVDNIAKGAALISDVNYKIELDGQCREYDANETLSKVMHEVMHNYPLEYSKEAQEDAKALSIDDTYLDTSLQDLVFGLHDNVSTDTGDVSQITPMAQAFIACEPSGTPMHSWQWVANGKSKMAHESIAQVGNIIAQTAIRVAKDKDLLNQIKEEFKRK